MDAKVKDFLDKAKAKERAAYEEERDKLLISLGLTTDKPYIEYSEFKEYQSDKWDKETKMYYREIPVPVKVTDEEYEEIKKYTKKEADDSIELDDTAESILGVLNTIFLILGIAATIFIIYKGFTSSRAFGDYILEAIIVLVASMATWAAWKVVLNMSNNLHQINSKIKK